MIKREGAAMVTPKGTAMVALILSSRLYGPPYSAGLRGLILKFCGNLGLQFFGLRDR